MTLTRRRKEFLQKISNLYKETKAPVHYVTVAKALGISKWTAYDILRELENEGFLTLEYAVNRQERNPGRSMVFFRPTPRSQRVLQEDQENTPEALREEEWLFIKDKLLGIFDNMKRLGAKKVIEELLNEIHTIEKPITFSAYTITLLIACALSLGSRSINIIKNLLHFASKPEQVLSLFTGTVMGTMIKSMKETITQKVTINAGKFQRHISEFNTHEKKLLVNFLGEALERATL